MKSVTYGSLALCLISATSALASTRRVLVSGAGGQTGQHVFRKLLARPDEFSPVGVVRTEESRQNLIDTGVPESSVLVWDVTDPKSFKDNAEDFDAIVICTSAKPTPTGVINEETGRPVFSFPDGHPQLVDWQGQKNQIDAAKEMGGDTHVLICSSMGGTNPDHPLNNLGRELLDDGKTRGGDILKWKRKAEKYLIDSGLTYTIVHPGGLLNEDGGKRELCMGVDDKNTFTDNNTIPREDVAEVLVQALLHTEYRGRSFDIVSKNEEDGKPTKDYVALLKSLEGRNCDYSLGEIAMEGEGISDNRST